MEEDDGWVMAAAEDAAMVAEVILSFKIRDVARPAEVLPVRWGRRFPRSRMPRCESSAVAESGKRKEGESSSARCSPTTPLSWSGGGGVASPSTGDGGFEESTSFSPSAPRSKIVSGETTSASTKNSRKLKTYAELKDEESFLLNERVHLRKEITTLQATYKEQSTRNQSLKRMKFCLNEEGKMQFPAASNEQERSPVSRCEPKEEDSSSKHIAFVPEKHSKIDESPGDARFLGDAVSNHDRPVLLFDLNTTPPEEEETSSGSR